jgi:hypothetical protein
MRPWIVLVLASAVILAGRPAGYGQPAITIRPVALVGDTTPSGGTFVKFDDRPNINENGDVLFHASVAGGKAERGIFLASQGTLSRSWPRETRRRPGARSRPSPSVGR